MDTRYRIDASDIISGVIPWGDYKCRCGYTPTFAGTWQCGSRKFSTKEMAEDHAPLKSSWR